MSNRSDCIGVAVLLAFVTTLSAIIGFHVGFDLLEACVLALMVFSIFAAALTAILYLLPFKHKEDSFYDDVDWFADTDLHQH